MVGGTDLIGTLIGLILPLGLDSFALSAAIAIAGVKGRARYRISAVMACFEGGMPLVGLLLGRPLGNAFGSTADYVAIGVLIAFGVWMLVHDEDEDDQMRKLASLSGWGMIVLGLSISMDELAIGFTIGLLKVPVIPALVAIFVQAFVLSQLGFRVGARVGERFTEGAEKLAGVVLVGLGLILVIDKIRG